MPFKINISNKGKTYKIETESEVLVGKKIGETFKGEDIAPDLKGYELEITGTSDLSGIPGFKELEGAGYHRRLLTYGPGMKNRKKGIRLRKTTRGKEISLKTHQINTKLVKQGEKKFSELIGNSKEAEAPAKEQKPAEAPAETPKKEQKPAEEPKQEKPAEQKPAEEPKQEKSSEEKPKEN